MPSSHYNFGLVAERLVAFYLICCGYRIIKRRYRNHFGEIDIIAKRGSMIAVVEVKARWVKTKKSDIENILKFRQLEKIKRSAAFFVVRNKNFRNCRIRYDFAYVGKYFLFNYYRGYFE